MIAKKTYWLDENGNPTTDIEKAARKLTEKGVAIMPEIVQKYGFMNGDLPEEAVKAETPSENKSLTPKKKQ